jgi:sugar phosphate isomerase/epimerase
MSIEKDNLKNSLITAVGISWNSYPDKPNWAVQEGFALEYGPDPEHFELIPNHLTCYQEHKIPIRYHGYFPGLEIGNSIESDADHAMKVHTNAIKAMKGFGEQVITVHVGLNKGIDVDSSRAKRNLSKLVEIADKEGVTVSLENLRTGYTSHIDNVIALADASGSKLTLDVGHAVSCEGVKNGELTVLDFIDAFESRLVEVHMYDREEDRHYPITNIDNKKHIIDRLISTDCRWWTIELNDYKEILVTRDILQVYLKKVDENTNS